MKTRPAHMSVYFFNSLLAHSLLISILLFIPLTNQTTQNETLRDFFVYLGKEGKTAAPSAPAEKTPMRVENGFFAQHAQKTAPAANHTVLKANPGTVKAPPPRVPKTVEKTEAESGPGQEQQQPMSPIESTPDISPSLDISGGDISNDVETPGISAKPPLRSLQEPGRDVLNETEAGGNLTNTAGVNVAVNKTSPAQPSLVKIRKTRAIIKPVQHPNAPLIAASKIENIPRIKNPPSIISGLGQAAIINTARNGGIKSVENPPLPLNNVQAEIINTPATLKPAPEAQQTAAPVRSVNAGIKNGLAKIPAQSKTAATGAGANKSGKDLTKRPSGRIPVSGILLPKDIRIEVLSDNTQLTGLMIRMLGRPYPSPDDDAPWSKNHEIDLKREAVPPGQKKPGQMFTIAHADKGVYTLIIKNASANACDADIIFRLHAGALKDRTKEYNGITLQPGQQKEFKFILPDMLFWDDNSRFSGTIQDSGTKTKFIYSSGLVWKEKSND